MRTDDRRKPSVTVECERIIDKRLDAHWWLCQFVTIRPIARATESMSLINDDRAEKLIG